MSATLGATVGGAAKLLLGSIVSLNGTTTSYAASKLLLLLLLEGTRARVVTSSLLRGGITRTVRCGVVGRYLC